MAKGKDRGKDAVKGLKSAHKDKGAKVTPPHTRPFDVKASKLQSAVNPIKGLTDAIKAKQVANLAAQVAMLNG